MDTQMNEELKELKTNITSPSKFATGVIGMLNSKAATAVDARRETLEKGSK